jgi:hypothetical protein
MTFNGVNAITLPVTGIYEATYTVTGGPSITPGYMSLQLYITTSANVIALIPGSIFYTLANSQYEELIGNVKFFAVAGDMITLANNTMSVIEIPTPPAMVGASSIVVGGHSFNQVVNTNVIVSTPINVSLGSAVYVAIQVGNGQQVHLAGVTDSNGRTYTLANKVLHPDNIIETEIWYINSSANTIGLTVTVDLTGNAGANIEVVELQGTAAASLGNIASNTGHSLIASTTGSTLTVGNFGLLSVVSTNNGNQSFAAAGSDFIIDRIPVPALGGQIVAGANLGEPFGSPGSYTMSANITGSVPLVDWAAALVFVNPASPTTTPVFCSCPGNAGLDIVLLQQF